MQQLTVKYNCFLHSTPASSFSLDGWINKEKQGSRLLTLMRCLRNFILQSKWTVTVKTESVFKVFSDITAGFSSLQYYAEKHLDTQAVKVNMHSNK